MLLVRLGVTSPAPIPTTGADARQSCEMEIRKSHSVGVRKLGMANMGGFWWRTRRLG